MAIYRIFMLFLLLLAGSAHATGGLDIYFLRHAETLANAKGITNTQTLDTLSDEGLAQVGRLTDALMKYRFDAILVGPATRALLTIQPYLKQSTSVAEVWPELTECCWQQERDNPDSGKVVWSGELHLPVELAPQFTLRNRDANKLCANLSHADGVAQVRRAAALIRQRYSNSGKTILIVSHYHAGQILLADLLGVEHEALPGLGNARITHLRQDEQGKFTLLASNLPLR